MPTNDDIVLLRRFADENTEDAFTALVQRYISLVYSVALRQTSNPHAAEEITQAVFIILARKAHSLGGKVVLAGWLYQTTRLTAANYLRTEIRRARREQEAYMQSTLNELDAEAWQQIAPLLDTAMGGLSQADRNAIVLRYFENKSMGEVAATLNTPEANVRKRVTRAVERLRKFFTKRGFTLTATAIVGAVSANSVQAAPLGLVTSITATAAKGTAVGGSILTLVKGALKIMAWTQAKTAITIGVGVLLAAGTTTVTVSQIQKHQTYSWQVPKADFTVFYNSPAQVAIVPTKFSTNGNWCSDGSRGALGIAQSLKEIIQIAYRKNKLTTVVECELPPDKYDFIAKLVGAREAHKNMPTDENWAVELQKEITKQFGVIGRLEERAADVLVLKPTLTGVRGFTPSTRMPGGRAIGSKAGNLSFYQQPIGTLAALLQQRLQIPIVNRSGLTNHYDYSVQWEETDLQHPNNDGLKQAIRDQLGLELVPGRELIEMLVIEKVK